MPVQSARETRRHRREHGAHPERLPVEANRDDRSVIQGSGPDIGLVCECRNFRATHVHDIVRGATMNKRKFREYDAVTEDGFTEWVSPKHEGYLMKCCDCGLVHEVDFRVVKYEPNPSEVYEVVEDINTQVHFKMRRYEGEDK